MAPEECRMLMDSLLEGDVTEADFIRLEAELSVDPNARQEYYQRVMLSMLLEREAESTPAEGVRIGSEVSGGTRRMRFALRQNVSWAFAGMAVTAILATIMFLFTVPPDSITDVDRPHLNQVTGSEQSASGFAVVAGQANAVWGENRSLADGSLVPSGVLSLQSGVVQFELFSGVQIVVEGKAEFAILSPMEVSVTQGKVRAHVPEPAHGFRLRTQQGEVVDLGTDFAVNVTNDHSEVHVLDGEIEWHTEGDQSRNMSAGEAVGRSSDGKEMKLTAHPDGFVGSADLQKLLLSVQTAKRENWQQQSETLRHDSRLIALYQVGATVRSNRRLSNLAIGRDVIAGTGAVVAASRTTDRWGQPGGAFDFSPTGSRVRLSVPGEYRSLSLLCWVKINSLDRWYNSLFLTDGHQEHEPHWQIMDDGRLFFSVKKRDQYDLTKGEKDKHIYFSPPFWSSALSGQWLMIATVYDVDARKVTHYLNGKILSEETIPGEYLVETVRIGDASLCNWGLPERDEPEFAVRNLNGSLDEFALFSGVLSPEEIKGMYDNGKP